MNRTMNSNIINIADRSVGHGHPCMIIAEAGVNHNGSLEKAIDLVNIAYQAGADVVKFQLYNTEEQVSKLATTPSYQYRNTGMQNVFEMSKNYDLDWDAHYAIESHCRSLGILYMTSCFDVDAVNFAIKLGSVCIKIASGEITNYPLLAHIASTNRTIILSTGMSSLEDVRGALKHIRSNGTNEIVLLQCASDYPASPLTSNLLVMKTYAKEFGVNVGFSDHTIGSTVAAAAVALGACVVEKHFTLDKSLPGPDHAMSLDPDELSSFVNDIRSVEAALGDGKKVLHSDEIDIQNSARRSIHTSKFIASGNKIEMNNITLKRPNVGIDPRLIKDVLGKTVIKDIKVDTPITWDMLK